MDKPLQILFLIPLFAVFSSVAAITPGSTLHASGPKNSWSSPSGDFSLQFVQAPSSSFLAAITYSASAAVIWSTRTTVDAAGYLQFLPSGDLALFNGSGATVWSSHTSDRGVTSAALDDSGNLVLENATGIVVWSSFDHPTDTVVPSQDFRHGISLTSGPYSFTVSSSGSLSLTWNNTIVYWKNSSVGANLTSPTLKLQSSGIVSMADPSLPGNSSNIYYSSDYGEGGDDVYRFLKLDSDGNLRIYSYSRGTKVLTKTWSAVGDQCRVFGYCGDFGICRYNDTDPICVCPSRNFEFTDPNDTRKGCKRKKKIEDCPGESTMLQLDHAVFFTYELGEVYTLGTASCKGNCLKSGPCECSTVFSDGSALCYMKTSAHLLSGYSNPTIPSTSYVKVCSPIDPNPISISDSKGQDGLVPVLISLAAILGLVLIGGFGLVYWFFRHGGRFWVWSARSTVLEYASAVPVWFTYKELTQSTKGFKEKLGYGGFGAVYKGVLANGTVVAVKRLEGIQQGEKQFRGEVATISSTHHLNLVRLVGFCSEGQNRLLVYEFMSNGSLDHFLFESSTGICLSWRSRFNIAVGAARGIAYLHEECSNCIVHCDIKPENILLDQNYNAKLSDFGLARLVNPDRYKTLKSSVSGTRGYLAPEWLSNLAITTKSDIYSFGMVLLEIVGGRRNFEVSEETERKKFSSWAYEEFEKGNLVNILDKRLVGLGQDVNMGEVMRVVMVGFWCIQEQPSQRPTVGKVVQMLEGVAEIEWPPSRPINC